MCHVYMVWIFRHKKDGNFSRTKSKWVMLRRKRDLQLKTGSGKYPRHFLPSLLCGHHVHCGSWMSCHDDNTANSTQGQCQWRKRESDARSSISAKPWCLFSLLDRLKCLRLLAFVFSPARTNAKVTIELRFYWESFPFPMAFCVTWRRINWIEAEDKSGTFFYRDGAPSKADLLQWFLACPTSLCDKFHEANGWIFIPNLRQKLKVFRKILTVLW